MGPLFPVPRPPETRRCVSKLCGCGEEYEDPWPSNLAPACRERLAREKQRDLEQRAKERAAERWVRDAQAEYEDALGKWHPFHKLPRDEVRRQQEQQATRYPAPERRDLSSYPLGRTR